MQAVVRSAVWGALRTELSMILCRFEFENISLPSFLLPPAPFLRPSGLRGGLIWCGVPTAIYLRIRTRSTERGVRRCADFAVRSCAMRWAAMRFDDARPGAVRRKRRHNLRVQGRNNTLNPSLPRRLRGTSSGSLIRDDEATARGTRQHAPGPRRDGIGRQGRGGAYG